VQSVYVVSETRLILVQNAFLPSTPSNSPVVSYVPQDNVLVCRH
jgi:hypothetical protein